MKSTMNTRASTYYSELFEEGSSLKICHPAVQRMQELSGRLPGRVPTALDKLEVYKECHRLADDLYRLTGNKEMFAHILRIGDLLLSRIPGSQSPSLHANQ